MQRVARPDAEPRRRRVLRRDRTLRIGREAPGARQIMLRVRSKASRVIAGTGMNAADMNRAAYHVTEFR